MQWTEQAIKASLDGTFTKVNYCGKVTTHRVPDPNEIPDHQPRERRPFGGTRKLRRPWSREEDTLLVDCRALGWTLTDIGKTLNRTSGSVHCRLYKLTEA